MTRKDEHSLRQAKAHLESIREMMEAYDIAEGDDKAREEAEQTILEDPLSIEVRSDWHTPGEKAINGEYCILLCTGGPAVRIIGDLNQYQEPENATLQHQDWGTPWTEYRIGSEDEELLLGFARQFYFAEAE